MKRDVVAGLLLVNAIPHAIVGLTGSRCMTPLGGEDSSPAQNLLWSAINLIGGSMVLASAPWRGIGRAGADRRRIAVLIGTFLMTTFGVVYEAVSARRLRAS